MRGISFRDNYLLTSLVNLHFSQNGKMAFCYLSFPRFVASRSTFLLHDLPLFLAKVFWCKLCVVDNYKVCVWCDSLSHIFVLICLHFNNCISDNKLMNTSYSQKMDIHYQRTGERPLDSCELWTFPMLEMTLHAYLALCLTSIFGIM